MAEISNLVRQTSSSTGTGNLSLAAVNGYRTFNAAFGTGTSDKFYYFIANRQAAEWEVGTGHLSDATTLVRDTVLASSNSNSAVSFSAGTKDVMNDLPADKQVNADDLAAVATTGAYGDLSGTPSLGSAAASDTGDFATAAQGTAADNALPKAGGTMTGNIAFSGSQTVDGRDLSADGSKLDGIESGADVTDATNVGTAIHGATGKTTPVDADELGLIDSAASNVLKKLTWANLKATLKTYFDTLYQAAGSYLTASGTATLTNKRVTARVGSTTSSATPTINTDDYDVYRITALTVNITSMTTNLSGTPTHGQRLVIEITGTATRTIAWGSSFEDGATTLPTTTDGTTMLAVGFFWNSATSKWRCMAAG